MLSRLMLLVMTPIAALCLLGADWPRFRGPQINNISPDKDLLTTWPKDGPKLLWQAKGVGGGYSSVTLDAKHLYTLGNKAKMTQLHCIDREDGKLLWSVDVGKEGGNLGCTPTIDGDFVYTVGQAGDLACVDTKKKEVIWKKNFVSDYKGKFGGWKYCESPLIDGDNLICTPGGPEAIMVAFNKKTGEEIWKTKSPFDNSEAGYSSIVISEVGQRHYVQLTASGLIGVAAKDGKLLWKYSKLGPNTANIPTPIILGETVFAAAGYGKGATLLKLKGDKEGVNVEEVYFKRELTNKHGGVVVVGDYVYGDFDDKGQPQCAEVKTGKVVWKRKSGEGGKGSGSAAVTYADGHLYFLYDNGVLSLVKASPTSYEEVSSFDVPKIGRPAWAHPVVVGGKLYVRGGGMVFCYDVKK